MGASDEEPKFPDLTPIGLAFAQAITYVNYRRYPDLNADAQAWLIDASTELINQLKSKLEELHRNKNDQTKLPAWALDPKADLCIYTGIVPYILRPYEKQFISSIEQLLSACSLNARVDPFNPFSQVISVKITFPEAGLKRNVNDATKEFVFDEGFQKKLFSAVKNMKLEG